MGNGFSCFSFFGYYSLTFHITSDGIPPYAYAPLPKLNSRQRYDISVDLLVPFTSSNLHLGNFMTSMTFSTSNNKTLAHVRRPVCIVPSMLKAPHVHCSYRR